MKKEMQIKCLVDKFVLKDIKKQSIKIIDIFNRIRIRLKIFPYYINKNIFKRFL